MTEGATGKAAPHQHGHRERLRKRLVEGGASSLPDYELLELLLFGANPRGDVKPLAKELIARFGTLAGVFAAPDEQLLRTSGLGLSALAILRAVPEAAIRMARQDILEAPVINSWDRLEDYCRMQMGRLQIEQFRLLFLDRKNRLIADEIQQTGTVDHTPVYVREVIKRSLELGATAIILVHNHPSGDPEPSRADIDITRAIQTACSSVGITVHDHLIVTRGKHLSFRNHGLL
ncbi:RadC family protein [Kiloniella sp. b19]|uniref:RadC family protein n=1 Tax=Kiloniella sp. GXU_MW_B19 TaxID=3141326 RepID=UPI0031E1E360